MQETIEWIDIKQGSPEWLSLRKKYIGASDAPVIMEMSPFKSPYQLWQEKVGLTNGQVVTDAMKRGNDLEEEARQKACSLIGISFVPGVAISKEHPFMMASLDGIDSEKKNILEIKCPGSADHAMAKAGNVPEKYIPQLQHQIFLCNIEKAYYFSYDGKDGVVVQLYRDDQFIKKLIKKEREFWECVESFTPPRITDKDYVLKEDAQFLNLVEEWKSLQEPLDVLKEKESQLRNQLIELANNQNCFGGGLKMTKVIKRGNVNYSTIPELQNVDLERYRGKSVTSWRMTAN